MFINGQNLGRYWNVGPQSTLYLPATLLHQGDNEVSRSVFEVLLSFVGLGATRSQAGLALTHPGRRACGGLRQFPEVVNGQGLLTSLPVERARKGSEKEMGEGG